MVNETEMTPSSDESADEVNEWMQQVNSILAPKDSEPMREIGSTE
jgi:hypothetical protein